MNKKLLTILPVTTLFAILSAFASTTISDTTCNLSINAEIMDVSCFGDSNGSIEISLEGAFNPQFQWSNGKTTQGINELSAGKYSVKITDTNCVVEKTYIVNQPKDQLQINITDIENISCEGIEDGAFFIETSGGEEPYSFSIDGEQNYTTNNFFDMLGPGEYEIVVRDAKDCELREFFSLSPAPSLNFSIGADITISSGEEIELEAPTGFDSYNWSTGDITQKITYSRDVSKEATETISVTVSKANGCEGGSNEIKVTVQPLAENMDQENTGLED